VSAQQANASGALADFNTIRNRASLNSYHGATGQSSLLIEIAHQRPQELFMEGDRWIDKANIDN